MVKNLPAYAGDARDIGLIPGKNLWSRKWQPSQEFFPVKFHGQKILWGYSPWGLKESGLSD